MFAEKILLRSCRRLFSPHLSRSLSTQTIFPLYRRSFKFSDASCASHPAINSSSLVSTRLFSTSESGESASAVGDLVRSHRIVVFMKGNPDEPRCGFSNAVCRILEMHGILENARQVNHANLFASYDVLESDELRAAVKTYADWPTIPQVYFDGEFVGGCDILLDMHRSGKLVEELERLGIGSVLTEAEKPA